MKHFNKFIIEKFKISADNIKPEKTEFQLTIEGWFYDYGPGSDDFAECEWGDDYKNDQKDFINKLAHKEFNDLDDILYITDDLYNQYDMEEDEIDKKSKKIINELAKIAKEWLKNNK